MRSVLKSAKAIVSLYEKDVGSIGGATYSNSWGMALENLSKACQEHEATETKSPHPECYYFGGRGCSNVRLGA